MQTAKTFMCHKEKEAITNTFVNSNLITAALIGTSVLKSPKINWKNSKKESKVSIMITSAVMQNLLKNPHQYQWRPKDFVGWFMTFSKHERYISLLTKCYS